MLPGYLIDATWSDYALPVPWQVNQLGAANNYNNGNSTPIGIGQVITEIGLAFQVWNDVPTSRAGAQFYGTTTETNAGLDGINLLTWSDAFGFGSNAYAVALVFVLEREVTVGPGTRDVNGDGDEDLHPTIYPDGAVLPPGTIIDADIKFNSGYYDWTDSPNGTPTIAWIRSVAVHEIGHFFGLAHSPYLTPEPPTMFPYTSSSAIGVQQACMTLEPDDISGISRYYPESSEASSYGAIAGKVMLSSSEGGGGCSVVAIDRVTGRTTACNITYGLWMSDGTPAGSYTIDWLPKGCYVLGVEYFDGSELRWNSNYNLDVWWSNVCNGTPSPLGFAPNGELYKPNNTNNDELAPPAIINVAPGQTVTLDDAYINTQAPDPPAGATQLTLADNAFVEYTFTDGFVFPYFGVNYSSVYVGSNGYLTFTAGDTDSSATVAEFAGPLPRIAALWSDLNPGSGSLSGGVYVRQDSARCVITCLAIPAKENARPNTVSITLYRQGTIQIDYRYLGGRDALVGISPGGSPTLQQIDYTATPTVAATGPAAIYELFSGSYLPANVIDLTGRTLFFVPTDGGAYDVRPTVGDVNDDGIVDWSDFSALSGAYGSEAGDSHYNPAVDLNGDGKIDFSDIAPLSSLYNKEL